MTTVEPQASDNLHVPPPSLRRHQTGADPHGEPLPHSDDPPPPPLSLGRQVTIHLTPADDDAAVPTHVTTDSVAGSDEFSIPAITLTRQITINQVDPEGNESVLVGTNNQNDQEMSKGKTKEEVAADSDELPPPAFGIAFERQSTQIVENDEAGAAGAAAGAAAADELPDDLPPVVGLAFTRQATQVSGDDEHDPPPTENNADEDDLPPPSIAFTRQSTQVVEDDENNKVDKETAENAKADADSDDLPPPSIGIAFVRQSTQVLEENEKNEKEAAEKEAAEKEAAEKEAEQDDLPPLSGVAFMRQSTQVENEEVENDNDHLTIVATMVKPITKEENVTKVLDADSLTIPEINPVFNRIPTDTNPHGGDWRASPRLLPLSPSPSSSPSPISSPSRFTSTSSISSFPSPSALTSSISTDSTSFFATSPEYDLFRFDSS